MGDFVSNVIATFVTAPLLAYIIVFIITKKITKKHRKAVNIALDTTTVLLIIAVYYLILVNWEISGLWMIILALLIIAILATIIQWKTKGEVIFTQVFRGFWRFNFLFFGTLYILLMCVGIYLSIYKAVA